MILALSAVAVPTAGATCPAGTTVTVADGLICAGGTDNFTIVFTSNVTLLPGNDLMSFTFGNGTSLANVANTDVSVTANTVTASPSSVTIAANHIEFPVPAVGTIVQGAAVTVVIRDVINPATANPYNLCLDYTLKCCGPAVEFCCKEYIVVPAASTYGFFWNSNPTYPGIAVDFVPPFKACGQTNSSGTIGAVPHPVIPGAFLNAFNLTLKPTVVGCADPCTTNVTFSVNMTAAPTGANVTLSFNNGINYTNLTSGAPSVVVGSFNLSLNTTWPSLIHFNVVGNYTICFKAVCPATLLGDCTTGCVAGAAKTIERCIDFKVYQWKDAAKIQLWDKWNLISLPLVPFDTTINGTSTALLASLPPAVKAELKGIWNYDRCTGATGTWYVYPTPGASEQALTTMQAGKSYWVKMSYPTTGCGNYTWWVWGTEKPMPPLSPAQYPVCQGCNMVGFTSLSAMNASTYLWNWMKFYPLEPSPVVYGWTQGCWTDQKWDLIDVVGLEQLVSGQGYWMAFPEAGYIYVP